MSIESTAVAAVRQALMLAAMLVLPLPPAWADQLGCSASARLLRVACTFDAKDDFFVAKAICTDETASEASCLEDAREERSETLEECADVLDARLELCDSLDDAAHEPAFGPAFADNFIDPLQIGVTVEANPFFPLLQGTTWVYRAEVEDDDGETVVEEITVRVTAAVKRIAGIDCLTVNDQVREDGVLIEDTDDWFAQDSTGNVWYCGEIAENFETFDGDAPAEPELVDIDGSFKAGRERARAGILVSATPTVGQVLRQEVSYGEAEDAIEVLAIDASESTPAASCDGTCLLTRDFTPLEPDGLENKYAAPGIGVILEVDPESGERVELVSFTVE